MNRTTLLPVGMTLAVPDIAVTRKRRVAWRDASVTSILRIKVVCEDQIAVMTREHKVRRACRTEAAEDIADSDNLTGIENTVQCDVETFVRSWPRRIADVRRIR